MTDPVFSDPKKPKGKSASPKPGKLQGKERRSNFRLPWWGYVIILAILACLIVAGFLIFVFKWSL